MKYLTLLDSWVAFQELQAEHYQASLTGFEENIKQWKSFQQPDVQRRLPQNCLDLIEGKVVAGPAVGAAGVSGFKPASDSDVYDDDEDYEEEEEDPESNSLSASREPSQPTPSADNPEDD